MSLINQVLQDLDRRQGSARALPAARLQAALPADDEPRRLLAGAVGAALVVVAIVAASALVWRRVDAHSAPSPAPVAALPATAVGHASWSRPPGDAIDFAAAAQAGSSLVTMPPVGAMPAGAVDVRTIGNVAEPTQSVAAPAPAAAPIAEARALQATIASRDSQPAPIALPVQLEKTTPPLAPADRAEAEYRRGIELHEHARAGDAEAAFAAALQHDGRHAAARRALAVEWIGAGRTGDAERILVEGLALAPQQAQLAVVLARIQAERRDLPGAIETLRGALRGGTATTPDQAEALALMATLQQGAGQHREAVDGFAAALRQSPQNGAWWIGLGISLAAEGRNAGAREAFERARATPTLAPELLLYVEQRLRTTTP